MPARTAYPQHPQPRTTTLKTLLPLILLLAVDIPASAAQSDAPQVADDLNTCVLCHSTPEVWSGEQARLYVDAETLAGDVHYQKGIQCHECHGGNPKSMDAPHATRVSDELADSAFDRIPFGELTRSCGGCHEGPYAELVDGAHARAVKRADASDGPLACVVCHRDPPHAMLPVRDPASSVFALRQVKLCGNCHESARREYDESGHGYGLVRSGLISSAACADCHGAHGIYAASDDKSPLHATQVANTCAKCHRFIEERLSKSVHGRGNGPGSDTASPAPGGSVARHPSCTDCHQGHDLPDPKSVEFRQAQPGRCGTCHAELNSAYGMSMHGELTNLGYDEGAKCSDCHGAHDILPLSDPDSRMGQANRLQTCATCHPGITANLASFDPHANHYDREKSAVVYWAYHGVLTFIIVVFGFFGLHAAVWFLRGLVDVIRHGRPRALAPHMSGYLRFGPFHRVAHTIMVISFLGLALTGLPLKFSSHQWAQWLAIGLGGFSSTGLWHRVFSITMFGCFFAYVFHIARQYFVSRRQGRSRLETLFGPDSPLPNLRDARDFAAMVRWFIGRGPRPTFERWAYWEKFDFFGAASDTTLIGVTGLILWFPNWFGSFLPGEAFNVAKVVHSTLALLATGFVFAIHFFGTHFRADKFPMDMSILTGVVSEEEMEHERPQLLVRWMAEGRLEEFRAAAPERGKLCGVRIAGFVALLIGLAALAGIIWSLLV